MTALPEADPPAACAQPLVDRCVAVRRAEVRAESDTFSTPPFPMSDGISTLETRGCCAHFHRPYYYWLIYP
jgi:hypothetical protein